MSPWSLSNSEHPGTRKAVRSREQWDQDVQGLVEAEARDEARRKARPVARTIHKRGPSA